MYPLAKFQPRQDALTDTQYPVIAERRDLLAEHALENRIHMLGVIPKVEQLLQSHIVQPRGDIGITFQLGQKVCALFPDLHRYGSCPRGLHLLGSAPTEPAASG